MRIAPALPSVGGLGKVITRCVSGLTALPPFAGTYDTAWAAAAARVPRTSAATSIKVRALSQTARRRRASERQRESVSGSPRGEAPRIKLVRTAHLTVGCGPYRIRIGRG